MGSFCQGTLINKKARKDDISYFSVVTVLEFGVNLRALILKNDKMNPYVIRTFWYLLALKSYILEPKRLKDVQKVSEKL